MTIYHGISLILLSVVILIAGMIKPKWILMWMDNPTRVMIAAICMVVFMVGAVLFGEGAKEKQKVLKTEAAIVKTGKPVAEPLEQQPKPAAVAAPPAQAPATSANDLRP